MCGRYVITSQPDALRALFGYDGRPDFPARYNIAPTQPVPVIRINEGRCEFALLRWGLIPTWVKDPRTVSVLFNARSDSVLDKPAFRNAIRRLARLRECRRRHGIGLDRAGAGRGA